MPASLQEPRAVPVLSTSGHPRAHWLRRWWPVILWACLIWLFSTAWFTSENTSRIIVPILHWLFPNASPHTLAYLHHLVRKTAHFVEYFVFSLLVLRAIRGEQRGARLSWALYSVALVAVYAALDESHQLFVLGRTASPWDVLLDTTGGVAAQAVVALRAYRTNRSQRDAEANDNAASVSSPTV
jgi:VanZ family protein